MSEATVITRDAGGRRPAAGPPARRSLIRRRFADTWPSAFLFIVAIAAWELVVEVFDISSFTIAKPSEIVSEIWEMRELLLDSTWITTQEIIYGFALSAIIGALLALAVARFAWLDRALYPLIVLFQNVPKVALAPILILWFGYEMTPKLLLVVAIAFFPITVNMRVGLAAVDPDLHLLMRSVGATRGQILRRIQIPTSLPYLFAGLRIAITFSVIGAIVAEFAGASEGLGYIIQFGSTQLDTPLVFAGLTLISILGLVLYYAMSALEWLVARRLSLPSSATTT
ncbi:MAG: ABC transporter permease [Solirubrobacteraceae bacterium]|nr:ABC transporter permease [Solirubrobacteraceae bacterium]